MPLFLCDFCNILLIENSDSLPLKNKYIRFQNYNPPSQNLILFSTQTSSFFVLKTIPCTKKLILIALKVSLCPCFHYNNFSGLKINIFEDEKAL